MIFKSKYLLERGLPGTAIENKLVSNTRWSLIHRIIFEHEGKCYQAYYSEGATEYQDESPWENEDEVRCTEVEQIEVLVREWVPTERKQQDLCGSK